MEILRGRSSFIGGQSDVINALKSLPKEDFYLQRNGKIVELDEIEANDFVQIGYRLLGGKGGFGSLLRSFRIHRSSNQQMMRDLNGRRVHDVKEEERLGRWCRRQREKEAERLRKKEEKYLKLKQGGPKHKIEDPEYYRKRDLVIDETEDSIEAGMKAILEEGPQILEEGPKPQESESSDDEDFLKGTFSVGKKRKSVNIDTNNVDSKKPKIDQPGPSGFKMPQKMVKTIKKVVKVDKKKEEDKPTEVKKNDEAVNYDNIDLNDYYNEEKLVELGAGHLKHALETRGLKCGGTVQERASRLFSIKGMDPSQYPKKLLANKK